MLKYLATAAVAASALSAFAGSAQAAERIDFAELSCEQFLAGNLEVRYQFALWFDGYLAGNAGRRHFNIDTVGNNVATFSETCADHPDLRLIRVYQAHEENTAENQADSR